jgi:hypothetical protein
MPLKPAGDRNRDGEREAVSSAGHQSARARRGLDPLAARAAVLLADVLPHDELARDDVDLFALLCLAAHLFE